MCPTLNYNCKVNEAQVQVQVQEGNEGNIYKNFGVYHEWQSLLDKSLWLTLYLIMSLLSNSSHLLGLSKTQVTLLFNSIGDSCLTYLLYYNKFITVDRLNVHYLFGVAACKKM